jgi:membrane protein DedA with SNARE-associated domain
MEASLHWVAQYGYVAIFTLLVLGIVGLPVPDEWLLTFAGYLSCKGRLQFLPTIAAASLGSMCGISLSYGLGRTLGFYLIRKYGRFLHITTERLNQVHNWFGRVGRWTLLAGYYVPGVRHLTAYVAGASRLEVSVFALFAYSGGFIWSLTFISLGYFLCEKWASVTEKIERNFLISSAILVILLLAYFFLRRKKPRLN